MSKPFSTFFSEMAISGTYVGVKFTDIASELISKFAVDNGIPNPLKPTDIHSTLMYSTIGFNYNTPDIPYEFRCVSFTGYALFGEALVMKVSSMYLQSMHNNILRNYNAKYTFASYIPHITLSYDAAGFDITSLPKYNNLIIMQNLYVEDLK